MVKVSSSHSQSWRPDPLQMRLLQAVTLSDDGAIAAWQAWKQQIDLDHLGEGSYQLLPRLYRQLESKGISDPMMARLKGVYRHVWSRNQINRRQLDTVISALGDQDISTCLLWGAATISRPNADLGICRTDDNSVLIQGHDLPTALSELQRLGWVPMQNKAAAVLRSQQHAVGLRHTNGANLTLHWHPLPAFRPIETALWQRAKTVTIGQTQTLILDETDQFLLSCVRATRWHDVPSFFWLADAATLAHHINKQHLIEQAEACQLTYALRQALTVLIEVSEDLQQPLANTLQQLQHCPASRFERAEFQTYSGPSPYGSLPLLWCQYKRLQSAPVVGFLRFLQQRWGLSQPWQVPLHLLRQSRQRIYRFGGS